MFFLLFVVDIKVVCFIAFLKQFCDPGPHKAMLFHELFTFHPYPLKDFGF